MAGVLAPSRDDPGTMTIVAAVGHAADDVEGVRVPLAGTDLGATHDAGEGPQERSEDCRNHLDEPVEEVAALRGTFVRRPALSADLGALDDLSEHLWDVVADHHLVLAARLGGGDDARSGSDGRSIRSALILQHEPQPGGAMHQ